MAVLIASDLRKDIAGSPLLRGVSLKLERRDRLTIAGRNGAGKTTLLRMLAGETSVDGGELVFSKGARVALHDQRPPRDRDRTLRDYVTSDAAIVLAAHDRWFLEAVGTSVLELEAGRSRFFPGTWAAWRKEAAARELALGKAMDKQQAEIARMERFIERFRYKASKARQAQSRVKKLAKIERIERDPKEGRSLEFQFAAPERAGRVIFELLDGRVEVGEPSIVLLDG